MTGQYRVLLFARYAELFGATEVHVGASVPTTAAQLCDALRELPGGALLPATPFLAVNGAQAPVGAMLSPDDEIALLPPLAGG